MKNAALISVGALCAAVAAGAAHDASVGTPPQAASPRRDTLRFVAHGEYVQAGLVQPRDTLILRNPLQSSDEAVRTGAKLYISYNCIDCHGSEGSGAMAPAFTDGRWHYGGSQAEVYESIFQGRPDGMPAWGGLIDNASIWRLVAYVRSLEVGRDVATENFTGRLVERSGH
jgi:cytochrome c oxidase cbb3-type subunit III